MLRIFFQQQMLKYSGHLCWKEMEKIVSIGRHFVEMHSEKSCSSIQWKKAKELCAFKSKSMRFFF